jgi:hypothetical protein
MFWWRGGDRFARLSSHSVSFVKNPSLYRYGRGNPGFKNFEAKHGGHL